MDLFRLAEATKNFSGAEIEGLVKDAAAYALNRNVDLNNLNKPLDEDNIKARRLRLLLWDCSVVAIVPAHQGISHPWSLSFGVLVSKFWCLTCRAIDCCCIWDRKCLHAKAQTYKHRKQFCRCR